MKTTKCTVAPDQIACANCHNTKTMQTGAGIGKGLVGRDGKNYWMNDITSHLYDVPRKDNAGVKGVEPGKAMPIPYTNPAVRPATTPVISNVMLDLASPACGRARHAFPAPFQTNLDPAILRQTPTRRPMPMPATDAC